MELLNIQIVLLHISTVLSTGEHVRLVNGITPNQGRVEIYHNREWGTICDNNFGNREARAVCRALGYRDGIPFRGAHFGTGTGNIFVDNLNCYLLHSSSYHPLQLGRTECSFRGWGVSYCNHGDDAGVTCKGSLVCTEGHFGYSCGSRCHCKEPGCNTLTGECYSGDCLPGWRGTSCSLACLSGTFGQSCTSRCHCRLSGCNPVTGVCTHQTSGCLPGWRGVRCDQECDDSKFGFSCGFSCHCKVPGCDSATGTCKSGGCLPGWRGSSCSQVCPSGTFGQSCTSRCHCRSSGCNPVTGVCTHQTSGCLPGWRGVRCDQEYAEGMFESSCRSDSHCEIPECYSTTGACKLGSCLPGWRGSSCSQEENKTSTTGYQVAISLLAVLLALAVFLIIGVYVKFKRMKKQNNHSTTENATRRTNGNRGLFAIALPRQGGLRDIAHIGRGNVAFHGAQVDIHFGEFARNQRNNNNRI